MSFVLLAMANTIMAQSYEKSVTTPLHVEIGMGAGTANNGILPIDANVNVNYTLGGRFTLQAVMQSSYFVPKYGTTDSYNRATNLGGGVGYIFAPEKNDKLGDFELRACVTTTIGGSNYKNTSYDLGIYWYSHTNKHKLIPIVGIGYRFRNYSDKSISDYNGAFFSLGIRF